MKKIRRGKMNVELLVTLVSEHKGLYDKHDRDYKNLNKSSYGEELQIK